MSDSESRLQQKNGRQFPRRGLSQQRRSVPQVRHSCRYKFCVGVGNVLESAVCEKFA